MALFVGGSETRRLKTRDSAEKWIGVNRRTGKKKTLSTTCNQMQWVEGLANM